ncbi:hypothetical protein [Paraburkholderia sp. Ac-20340]|uniref:hypothetical protein n=1 Tax=Paraburkholderia sp. Ac-20340 TaxID=2703888 RepID=UPI001981F062|nr:hypothetical protein [Paraburkholderia sp. Ac-20340]
MNPIDAARAVASGVGLDPEQIAAEWRAMRMPGVMSAEEYFLGTPENAARVRRERLADMRYAQSHFPSLFITPPAAAGGSTLEQTMSTVRAKFKVTSTSQREHWDSQKGHIHEIELSPVVNGSPENDAFYAATPGGVMKLQTVNHEAGVQFELGGEYYVDFTKA